MKATVIIPVYNEELYVSEVIKKVSLQPAVAEILAVNDGSTDGTAAVLEKAAASFPKLKAIHMKKNSGKGAAIAEGLRHASGEVVIVQDADLEYDPGDYPALLAPFEDPAVTVVYGSRMRRRHNKFSHVSFALGGMLVTLATNLLYFTLLTDEPTGYKLFRTEVLKGLHLESRGFEFCPEVTAKVLRRGHRIIEIPISYNPRHVSEGKKIRFRDGVIAIWTLLRYRFY